MFTLAPKSARVNITLTSFCFWPTHVDYLAWSPLPVPLSPRPAPPSSALTSLSRWRRSVDPARRSSSISPSPARCSSPQGSACGRLGHTMWRTQWRHKMNNPFWFVNTVKKKKKEGLIAAEPNFIPLYKLWNINREAFGDGATHFKVKIDVQNVQFISSIYVHCHYIKTEETCIV